MNRPPDLFQRVLLKPLTPDHPLWIDQLEVARSWDGVSMPSTRIDWLDIKHSIVLSLMEAMKHPKLNAAQRLYLCHLLDDVAECEHLDKLDSCLQNALEAFTQFQIYDDDYPSA